MLREFPAVAAQNRRALCRTGSQRDTAFLMRHGAKEGPLLKRNLTGNSILVDVFFLCVVDSHKGLYRLDDALCVAD